jgi:hypothetical protein
MCKPPYEATNEDYNNDSDTSDSPKYDNSDLFKDDNNATNEDIDETTNYNSGYNTNKIEVTIIEDIDSYYTTKIDKFRELE